MNGSERILGIIPLVWSDTQPFTAGTTEGADSSWENTWASKMPRHFPIKSSRIIPSGSVHRLLAMRHSVEPPRSP